MESSSRNFSLEVLGRILLVICAVTSARLMWWAPLVVAPLFWQVWDSALRRHSRIHMPTLKLIADGITYALYVSYVVYAIATAGKNIGHWYGWTLGAVTGIAVAHVFGLLFPFRWHIERIEGDL